MFRAIHPQWWTENPPRGWFAHGLTCDSDGNCVMRYGRGEPEDTDDEECTCRTPSVNSASIDPPEYKSIRDPWCPVHGKDPDEAYEEARDDAQFFGEMGWDNDDY